jgi:hypothetical protein
MNPLRVVYEDTPAVIPVPDGMRHRRTEVVFRSLDEPADVVAGKGVRRRSPPPSLAGKVHETGDVMSTVPPADWGIDE